jgi:hypothetical protein
MQEKKRVYLAGKITGDPLYRSKFYDAANILMASTRLLSLTQIIYKKC